MTFNTVKVTASSHGVSCRRPKTGTIIRLYISDLCAGSDASRDRGGVLPSCVQVGAARISLWSLSRWQPRHPHPKHVHAALL